MSCLFLLSKNPDLKNFDIYIKESAKIPNIKIYYIYTKVSAPLRSLPPAHALENGF